MSAHEWCPKTHYCVRCGKHMAYASYNGLECINAANVSAIAHLRALAIQDGAAQKRFAEMHGEFIRSVLEKRPED